MIKKILQVLGVIFIIEIVVVLGLIVKKYSESKVAVLNYHNVLAKEELKNIAPEEKLWCISEENFEEEMEFLHKHKYKTLTMEEFCKWKKGELKVPFKSVLITFDDGLLSNYKYAMPILKKYNLNATIFVIGETSEKIGEEPNEWNGNYNSYMSKKQLEKMVKDYPNIELYSHTYGIHKKINDNEAVHEISKQEMKEDIEKYEKYMGKTEIIAYPFGATNPMFVNTLKENGYKYGFLLGENKKATRADGDFYINRINVSTDKDILHFAARLLLPY